MFVQDRIRMKYNGVRGKAQKSKVFLLSFVRKIQSRVHPSFSLRCFESCRQKSQRKRADFLSSPELLVNVAFLSNNSWSGCGDEATTSALYEVERSRTDNI